MTSRKGMKLVLETGQEFKGLGYGSDVTVVGEIVFNTSMVGYQEIVSDPAYAGQIVVMTYPLMGQYGIMDDDFEARSLGVSGLVVKECCETPSNFRYTKTLSEELEERSVPCIAGIDTRMLTRIIRGHKSIRAAIVGEDVETSEALEMIKNSKADKELVNKVSCKKRWFSRTPHHTYDVVAIDCGIKHSIVTALNRCGCNVTVVPFDTKPEDILAFNPDGVILSSGPGSPEDVPQLIDTIKALRGKLPVYGIGLGHLLIAMSYGAKIYRMECGHHGGHPVRNTGTGRIITAEHNHDFAVCRDSVQGTGLSVTYLDVADGTVEGLENAADKVNSVQFYPEGAPGPQESTFFDTFIKSMEK